MKTREHQDHIGKRLFREPSFVADVLGGFVQPALLGELKLDTLRPMPAEFINRRGAKRLGDALWLADRPGGSQVLALIEVESTKRRRIAARVMNEIGLLYERPIATGRLAFARRPRRLRPSHALLA